MAIDTFWECYFTNNPESQAELAELVAPDVLALISTGQIVEVPAGLIDGINDTFTLADIPNPPNSLALSLISGGGFTLQLSPADYSTAIIAGVLTISMTVPPIVGESLQAVYYAL